MYNVQQVVDSIIILRHSIRWKPKKAESHLAKRIRMGHLPEDTGLVGYEMMISYVADDINSKVYVYTYGEIVYPTLTGVIGSQKWLVMIGLDGVMETAFPPDDLERYISNDGFIYLGLLGDFLI